MGKICSTGVKTTLPDKRYTYNVYINRDGWAKLDFKGLI